MLSAECFHFKLGLEDFRSIMADSGEPAGSAMRLFSEIPNPRLGAGVRDLYSRGRPKGHALNTDSDPSPWQKRQGFGISEK
jgi:hypothetical protein